MAAPLPALEPQQQRSIETRRRLLDAAVEELLENGYGKVTTVSVARRAQVTRGAQQHHFPNKDVLVAEAVRHLARRQSDELAAQLAALRQGKARVANALDLIYAQYGGPLFAAMFELSLAARHEPALRDLVREEEQGMAGTVHALGRVIFGPAALRSADFAARWAAALSTIRGIAVLRILGHSERALQRQWRFARGQIVAALSQ
ncbi:putative HTH-type transcriptional regulator [Paraconexibacter sp. AEG42_29]|uniref:HTH-type transcriptional regulator n=1 Tax=Paraconexibacter sp. AEG42_29 TaxID=2997339 RepID=A0AAU7AZY0_9ACTN